MSGTNESNPTVVLLVPPGVAAPQDFPFEIMERPDDDVALVGGAAKALTEPGVRVVALPGELVRPTVELARFLDVEIRALLGMEGDYPSYWMASTATLPPASVQEIQLAGGQTEAAGGSGVQADKAPTATMKPADEEAPQRRQDTWARAIAARKANPTREPSITEESSDAVDVSQ